MGCPKHPWFHKQAHHPDLHEKRVELPSAIDCDNSGHQRSDCPPPKFLSSSLQPSAALNNQLEIEQ
jgi:hypothetical protein